jgi:hypothetical protein
MLSLLSLTGPVIWHFLTSFDTSWNSFLWVFANEPLNVLSWDGCNHANFLLNHIHHCKSNIFIQDETIWTSGTSIHHSTNHTVDCANESSSISCRWNILHTLFMVLLCFLLYIHYLIGHVSMQNIWTWSEGNPHAITHAFASVSGDELTENVTKLVFTCCEACLKAEWAISCILIKYDKFVLPFTACSNTLEVLFNWRERPHCLQGRPLQPFN